jgi:hypothetical protein
MDPLAVGKQWYMVQCIHQHHNILMFVFKSLYPRCWVCTSGAPMSPMHSQNQIVPSRSITCAIKFSNIGGRHGTLIFNFPPMWLFLSSRTSRAIMEARASGPSVVIRSLSRSSSRTLHIPCVCTTSLSMVSVFSYFGWSTIFSLHANLRKHIPSSVTCCTRTGKYPCCNTA